MRGKMHMEKMNYSKKDPSPSRGININIAHSMPPPLNNPILQPKMCIVVIGKYPDPRSPNVDFKSGMENRNLSGIWNQSLHD
jgi:hypothetical protein